MYTELIYKSGEDTEIKKKRMIDSRTNQPNDYNLITNEIKVNLNQNLRFTTLFI